MRRYLCVWLPDWPLDRLRRMRRALKTGSPKPAAARGEAKTPFVLTETGPRGLVVAAMNRAAAACAISPGLSFSDACARAPGLMFEEIDRDADAAALRALAFWMMRWSPVVALDGDDGVMLDITGCAHLFGGEAALSDEVSAALSQNGIRSSLGLAASPGAAWALAHEGEARRLLPPGEEREGLEGLPVAGLRLSDDALTLLRRFGLTRIGQLCGIDRKALARRFQSRETADRVLFRLDQALGARGETLDPIRPPPDYAARLPCPEPLGHLDGVRAGLERLLGDVARQLASHGVGARWFSLSAFCADGAVSQASLTTSRPVRDAAHILKLFRERIERIDPGFGIDLLVLEARGIEPIGAIERKLSADFTGAAMDEVAVAALADRISARLGDRAVSVLHPNASHIPERAETPEAFKGVFPDWGAHASAPCGGRPLKVFARPEAVEALAEVPDGPPLRFTWRRVARRVVRAAGPERIAPEWWRHLGASARARDYYQVEDEAGRRYWLYRDGLYDDHRGGPPQWFVQGVFA